MFSSNRYAVLNSRPEFRPGVELDNRCHFSTATVLCQKEKGETGRLELGPASPVIVEPAKLRFNTPALVEREEEYPLERP